MALLVAGVRGRFTACASSLGSYGLSGLVLLAEAAGLGLLGLGLLGLGLAGMMALIGLGSLCLRFTGVVGNTGF